MASTAPENSFDLAALSPAKRAALEAMLLAKQSGQAAAERIPRREAGADAVLSYAEQRLWLLDRLEPNHPFYNMPLAARLTGKLDPAAFSRSLSQLVTRHETLRYGYTTDAGQPRRTVHDEVTVAPRFVDLRGEAIDDAALQRRMRVEARTPFDLSSPPLLRCVVYELSDEERVVLLVMHHIISDGWSMGVMLAELAALYDAAVERPCIESPLAPLPIQYSDFAVWQRERLDGEPFEEQVDFWRRTFADAPPPIELPIDFARSPVQDFDGAVLPFALPATTSKEINATAQRFQATPFMVLMAAYQAWLSRYTGEVDVCVGSAVANRTKAELEKLIGFFVNTLAVRSDLSDDPAFEEL
ncbi:MAG: condensation domain-containing protein, partial [Planctomycetota bacterium]